MAVTYATPDVETPERALELTAQSDALDAIVGDLEAYSQDPLADTAEYEVEGEYEYATDKRSIVVAAAFFLIQMILVMETVFVVLFEPVDPGDPVGSVISGLLGVALFANFVAAIAAAWAAEADRRWQASVTTSHKWISFDD